MPTRRWHISFECRENVVTDDAYGVQACEFNGGVGLSVPDEGVTFTQCKVTKEPMTIVHAVVTCPECDQPMTSTGVAAIH